MIKIITGTYFADVSMTLHHLLLEGYALPGLKIATLIYT